MQLEFKNANINDIDTIYNLNKQLIDMYEDVESIEYEKVLAWVKRKITKYINEYTCVVLNNQTVGYYHFHQDEARMEIDDLYVLPEYQNKGIGSKILEKCCLETRLPIYLYVFSKNVRAIALYERFGFKIIENINNSRYIMQRDM